MTFALLLKNWQAVVGGVGMLALSIALGLTTVDRNQYRAAARKADATNAKFAVAQKQAGIAARKAIADKERQYKDQAHEADQFHTAELADARSAADRYIASHRVPACHGGGASGGAAASPQGGGAAVPASLPADAVVVASGDVQACTAVAKYALDAHNWAVGLSDHSPINP
jgi:hypothetical protein